jgi:DNA-binding beta-propeller fold protein YncE/PKD repeat protein
LSGASAGTVEATAFVNYNASLPGNFPGAVWSWDGGRAAVDPLTGDLWIPEWSISVLGLPVPRSAPALVYDPATNSTQLVKSLTNTSAMAFDPLSGYLYATDPVDNTVVVLNPTTGSIVGAPIPVGINPQSILYDNMSQNIFVANEVSNNVTVINGTTSQIQSPGISAGKDPVALADDTTDRTLFVGDAGEYSGAYNVSAISTRTDTEDAPRIFLTNPVSSLAFAKAQDLLAVGAPASQLVTIYHGQTPQAFAGTSDVGYNVSSIISNVAGTEFVAANETALHLILIQANSGVITPSYRALSEAPDRLTINPANGLVYAWSALSRTITLVNLSASAGGERSPTLGAEAETLAYDGASGRVFVADWRNDTLSVLNASTFGAAQPPIELPAAPTSLVDDAATGTIYVAYTGGVSAIDAATGAFTAQNNSIAGNNTQLVLNPLSNLLWVVNELVGLEALSLPSLTVTHVVGTGVGTGNVRGAVLDPFDDELFVANLSSSLIVVVNASTGAIIDHGISGVPGLQSLAYDSADQMIYALGSAVWIINPSTNAIVVGPIPIVPHLIAFSIVYDPSREFLYVTSYDKLLPPYPGNITVIDGSSVSASQGSFVSIPVGQAPIDIQPVQLPGSSAPGSSEIWVTNFLSGTVSVIASPPSVAFLAANPNPVDVGVQTTVLLGFTGGAGPSTVSFAGLPSSCDSSNTNALNCTPNAAGTYDITANIVDSLGFSTSGLTVLSVSPAIQLLLQLNPGPTSQIELGTALSGNVTVTGGTAPYTYAWAFGDDAVASDSRVTHTYASAGVYLITVTVTDSGGGISSATAIVTVAPVPTVTVSASPSNVTDVNVPIALRAIVTNGTAPGNGSWTFGDGTTALGPSVQHAYSTAGIYFAIYHYQNASGANFTSYVSVLVHPALSGTLTVTTLPSNSAVSTGTLLQFNTSIVGGTSPYIVTWAFDDGSYGSGISSQHSYGQPGTYVVTLVIADAVGAEWNTTYRVVVGGSTPSSLGADFVTGLILGLLVGATAATLLLLLASRSKKQQPPSPPTAYVPPAPAPEGPEWAES